jgi:hypothetical protein
MTPAGKIIGLVALLSVGLDWDTSEMPLSATTVARASHLWDSARRATRTMPVSQ